MKNFPGTTPAHLFFPDRLKMDTGEFLRAIEDSGLKAKCYFSVKTCANNDVLQELVPLIDGFELDFLHDYINLKQQKPIIINGSAINNEFFVKILENSGRGTQKAFLLFDSHSQIIRFKSLITNLSVSKSSLSNLVFGFRLNNRQSHFGVPNNKGALEKAINTLTPLNLSMLSVHTNLLGGCHNSNQINKLVKINSETLKEGYQIAKALGSDIKYLDVGGGLSSPYVYELQADELTRYHLDGGIPSSYFSVPKTIYDITYEYLLGLKANLPINSDIEIILEPGRIICSRAMSTLIKTISVKEDLYYNNQILITDSSINNLAPMHKQIHPIINVDATPEARNVKTYIYSCIPHSASWISQNIFFPMSKANDRLLIEHTGAYFLACENGFNFQPTAWYHS